MEIMHRLEERIWAVVQLDRLPIAQFFMLPIFSNLSMSVCLWQLGRARQALSKA